MLQFFLEKILIDFIYFPSMIKHQNNNKTNLIIVVNFSLTIFIRHN